MLNLRVRSMSLQPLFDAIDQQEWIDIPKGWLQGRTIFGGLSTAMMIHKATAVVNDPSKRLLSSSISFVGPVQEEKPVKITVEILRQGRSVTTVEARVWQDDAVQSILLASFGSERASSIEINQQRTAPDYPAPETLFKLPHHQLMPQCYQNFDLAWAEGAYPCSGSEQADFGGWFRYHEKIGAGLMSTSEFVALLDIWPAGAFSVFKTPAPASSLSWHVTLLDSVNFQRSEWFKYKVFTDHAKHGYATEYAHIWDRNDRLIAISRQTVTLFA